MIKVTLDELQSDVQFYYMLLWWLDADNAALGNGRSIEYSYIVLAP